MIVYKAGQKQCFHCKEFKNPKEFYPNKNTGDGLYSHCNICDNEITKKYYNKYLKKNRKLRKNWQDNNKELHKNHVRNYYARKKIRKMLGEE